MIGTGDGAAGDETPEQTLVAGLIDFDDISYDDDSELLFDLAGQVADHLRARFGEGDVAKTLRFHQKAVAAFVHAQMARHSWESDAAAEFDVEVSRGFTPLKSSAFTAPAGESPRDFRHAPADKSSIGKYLYGGFERALFELTKFQSDPERVMAVILDRDSQKWFRPAAGQFRINYRLGAEIGEYQPDFVAEMGSGIALIETKRADQMADAEVAAKRDAAVQWCGHASAHAARNGGKRWVYLLVPHDKVAENRTLESLANQFTVHAS